MKKIIVDLLSDTHNRHNHCQCEGGDIIIHAGDVSGHGDAREIISFLDWFGTQDYSHKILVPGNHDFGFENSPKEFALLCKSRGITLLNDSGITVEGIKIWGSPVQPWFHDWAFNRQRGHEIRKHWNLIPKDTEILITHGPPAGTLDMTAYADGTPKEPVGCADLTNKLAKLQVKLHVFGHIHEARGIKAKGDCTYVNASFLDRSYYPQAKQPIRAVREVCEDGSIVYLAEER
jgi:Icc-related predicted phosphoesterase